MSFTRFLIFALFTALTAPIADAKGVVHTSSSAPAGNKYPGLVVEVYYHRMSKQLDDFLGLLLDLNQSHPVLIQPKTYWVVDKTGLPRLDGSATGFPNLNRIKTHLDRSGKRAKKVGLTSLPGAHFILMGDSMVFDLDEAPEKVQLVIDHLKARTSQSRN